MCMSFYVHDSVQYCTLMMVCGSVLGKAKTTKVGMVWYELNIVNQSMNDRGRNRAARAAKNISFHDPIPERIVHILNQ